MTKNKQNQSEQPESFGLATQIAGGQPKPEQDQSEVRPCGSVRPKSKEFGFTV